MPKRTGTSYLGPTHPGTPGPYSLVPGMAVYDPHLSASALRVLVALCSYANKAGVCWPAQETLAKNLGCSRQSVGYFIGRLLRTPYLERLVKGYPGRTSVYRVVYDPDLTLADVHGIMDATDRAAMPQPPPDLLMDKKGEVDAVIAHLVDKTVDKLGIPVDKIETTQGELASVGKLSLRQTLPLSYLTNKETERRRRGSPRVDEEGDSPPPRANSEEPSPTALGPIHILDAWRKCVEAHTGYVPICRESDAIFATDLLEHGLTLAHLDQILTDLHAQRGEWPRHFGDIFDAWHSTNGRLRSAGEGVTR